MAERTVLIIDDDQTLVAALKEGLETLGFKVSTAYDGLQGILQAHSARPQVIMLDFNMPAGGGSGVYERLRGSSDTGKIPIVFLTGATVEEVKGKIRSTPNTYFLRKPVSVAQMRKVLDKILGAARAVGGPATEPAPGAPPAPFAMPTTAAMGTAAPDAPFAGLMLQAATPPPPPIPGAAKAQAGAPPAAFPSPAPAAPPPAQAPANAPAPQAQRPAPGALPGSEPTLPPAPGAVPAAPGLRLHAPAPGAKAGSRHHEFEVRVTLADADRLGIIYYANYLRYFEAGRVELLRAIGIRYRDLEMERHIFLPVVEARVEYLAPSRYDDLLLVRTWLSWMGPASLCFRNEVYDREAQDKLVARGLTRHAVLNEYWKPARLPKDVKDLLKPYLVE